MTKESLDILIPWLMARESDIALGIEDFDCLRPVFKELVGKDASSLFAAPRHSSTKEKP